MTADQRPIAYKKPCFVYIVRCSDDSLYIGKAIDISARISKHNSGLGAKYTRSRLPVCLVYAEEHPTNKEAAQREYQLKGWSKQRKEIFISENTASLKTINI